MTDLPHREADPAPSLLQLLPRLPSGPCLDLACGAGRNGLLMARRGDPVEGWDRDVAALETFAQRARAEALDALVALHAFDLELPGFRPPARRFRTVLVFRYLWRALAPAIEDLIEPGGVLLYETFTDDPAGRGAPRNPEFRLRCGELPRLFPRLRVELFREHVTAEGQALALLLARQPM